MELIKLLQALFGKKYLIKLLVQEQTYLNPSRWIRTVLLNCTQIQLLKNSDVVKFIEKKIAEYGPFALSNKNASEVKTFEMNARRLLNAKRGQLKRDND